ncbi:MAG: hypothetical protein Q8S36_09550 [Sulfuricurvum sp.]|nr:hypothetical protein [Sulfuricurvum sp.]
MNNVHLIEAPLEGEFDIAERHPQYFEREYDTIGESDDDAIGQWLRVAKAKGETSDSDPVVLHLIVELYRKIDRLEQIITNTTPTYFPLSQKVKVCRIGFEHFEISEPLLESGKRYYGRIVLPLQNKKVVPLYFEAQSTTLAKIVRIHSRDEREWGAYARSKERLKIRHLKGNV